MRFSGTGQCAFLEANRQQMVASLPCSVGTSGFVSQGDGVREWQVVRIESERYVALESLFAADSQLVMGKLETESLLDWQCEVSTIGRQTNHARAECA